MVISITDALKFYFLPAFKTFFHQYLRSKCECAFSNLLECFFVRTNTRAKSTKCICRTNHNRITYATRCSDSLIQRFTSLRYWNLKIYLIKFFYKEVSVFCVHNCLNRRSQHLYAIFLQYTFFIKFCTTVKCCLTTECQQNTVRTFFLDYLRNEMCIHGKEIYLVRNTLTRLYCCNIRVNKYTANTFLTQSLKSLRT